MEVKEMNIPLNKVLEKMQFELQYAKQSGNDSKVRDHVLVIRSLCDLIIDDQPKNLEESTKPNAQFTTIQNQPMVASPQKIQHEKGDGNGDSIFDF